MPRIAAISVPGFPSGNNFIWRGQPVQVEIDTWRFIVTSGAGRCDDPAVRSGVLQEIGIDPH